MGKDLAYRHIIKTFVPGLFTTIILIVLSDFIIIKSFDISLIEKIKSLNSSIIISLLIPFSLFFGIIINTICFTIFIPLIVKHHVEKSKKKGCKKFNFYKFTNFKNTNIELVNKRIYKELYKNNDKVSFEEFSNNFEPQTFLLHYQGIENLNYIKTGYWYYLEFQLNSIITLIIGYITFSLTLFFRIDSPKIAFNSKIFIFIVVSILLTLICILLYKAIIKNLERDKKKEFSFILGAFNKLKLNRKL